MRHDATLGQGRAARRTRAALHGGRRPCARQSARRIRRACVDRACRDAARLQAPDGEGTDLDPRWPDRDRRGPRARRVVRHARPRGWADRARDLADAAHRRRRCAPARGSLAQRPGARRAASVPARRDRGTGRRRPRRRGSTRRPGRGTGLDPVAGLHAHAAGDAELGGPVGPRVRRGDPATTSRPCATHIVASSRIRSAPPQGTAPRTCP